MCEKQWSDSGGTRWACSFLVKLMVVCFFMLFAIDYQELKQRVSDLEQTQHIHVPFGDNK